MKNKNLEMLVRNSTETALMGLTTTLFGATAIAEGAAAIALPIVFFTHRSYFEPNFNAPNVSIVLGIGSWITYLGTRALARDTRDCYKKLRESYRFYRSI